MESTGVKGVFPANFTKKLEGWTVLSFYIPQLETGSRMIYIMSVKITLSPKSQSKVNDLKSLKYVYI